MLSWPLRSPDLSPIEDIWDILGRGGNASGPRPRNEGELWNLVNTTLSVIDQNTIGRLINSMPRRVADCIARHDSHTVY